MEFLLVLVPALIFGAMAVVLSAVGVFGLQPEAGAKEGRNRRVAVFAGAFAVLAVAWLAVVCVWALAILFSGAAAD